MSNLERLSYIMGVTLLGIAAVLIRQGRRGPESRKQSAPVEKLAGELRKAWAGYHNR